MDIKFTNHPCISPASNAGLTATDWIAICSALIALIALAYSIYQGIVQRRHQILGAKPILEFHVSNGKDLLVIRNEGFGPASITSFTAEAGGNVFDMTTRGGIRRFVEAVTAAIDQPFPFEGTRFDSGTVFGVGKEVTVVSSAAELTYANRQKVTEGLASLKLSIEYTCIYGEIYKKDATFEQVVEADSAGLR
ncbi:hypothetical protein [Stenotrophomonas maltophilia]|uniref:hypothetical protein n=1 Tax=Stenotrophomonas maltophilia TaxID=40324 RepID=UPI002894F499|nr:hypothetical protein [Stenotrophomonas maltophilia]MDT3487489.1 hypothetical protein [Stenotrophomonas maltophilia]